MIGAWDREPFLYMWPDIAQAWRVKVLNHKWAYVYRGFDGLYEVASIPSINPSPQPAKGGPFAL